MEIVKNSKEMSNDKETFPPMKIETFGPSDIIELYNDYDFDKYALKSFGLLLSSSDLEMFAGDSEDSGANRLGLEKLIRLYMEQQGQRMDEIREKAVHCPDFLIDRAESTYNNVKDGMFNDYETSLEHVQEAIWKMDQIIFQLGQDKYPKAVEICNKLKKLQKSIVSLIGNRRKS